VKRILIASDLHARPDDMQRTSLFEQFLKTQALSCDRLYLLGDIFEFGFVFRGRILPAYEALVAAIGDLVKKGIEVFFLAGNHDIWMSEYLRKRGLKLIIDGDIHYLFNRKVQFFHGILREQDALSKFAARIMNNPTAVWLYSRIPCGAGFKIALNLARVSRKRNPAFSFKFPAERLKPRDSDAEIIVSAHHHYPCKFTFEGVEYYIVGDWITHFTYLEITKQGIYLKEYRE